MNKNRYTHVVHGFEPVFDENSRVLILGSLPSVASREVSFYYGHRQNRFWRVTAALCGEAVPESIEEKKTMLLSHGIALWDVIAECDIIGSSDADIKNVVPADLSAIFGKTKVTKVYANGRACGEIYKKYNSGKGYPEITVLPSTSPANAAWSLERLIQAWGVTLE